VSLLNFLAMEPARRVLALKPQTRATMWPFERYVSRAMDIAKERQFRYVVPWEPVRNQLQLRLDPQDTVFRLSDPKVGWVIKNWPLGLTPQAGEPLTVVRPRSRQVAVESWSETSDGVVVYPAEALTGDEMLFWCGHACELQSQANLGEPREITLPNGGPLKLRRAWRDEDGDVICVEGKHESGALLVNGLRRDAEATRAWPDDGMVEDAARNAHKLVGGMLKVDALPSGQHVTGSNGVRFGWRNQGKAGRDGHWVQLLPPESGEDDEDAGGTLDPRAAFCDGDLEAVWTQKWFDAASTFKVRAVDRDNFQIRLDRLPPVGTELYLPIDKRALELQQRAVQQLQRGPLPAHRALLRLCEDPEKVRWPDPPSTGAIEWEWLESLARDGTDEQRRFVERALASPDIALLQGPPGSGKTTAICELVLQCIRRGQRVLLCASTNVAIDNALEKLLQRASDDVYAVRIGHPDRVDDKVLACQLDERVRKLLEAWDEVGSFAELSTEQREAAAENVVLMAANLTCGTTTGILKHPQLDKRFERGEYRPITTLVPWDLLIVDEASKTTISEFFVPALLARKYVIVGDVHQLPPFTERRDLVANLEFIKDPQAFGVGEARELFTKAQQEARILRLRLTRRQLHNTGTRWLVVREPSVLDALESEFTGTELESQVVRIREGRQNDGPKGIRRCSADEVLSGGTASLWLAASTFILVEPPMAKQLCHLLPSDLLQAGQMKCADDHAWPFRRRRLLRRRLQQSIRERGREIGTAEELEKNERKWLAEKSWASEVAWRLTRIHELKLNGREERQRLIDQLNEHLPDEPPEVAEYVHEVYDIALPSIMEVVQEGIGAEHSKRRSTLTDGLSKARPAVFESRFVGLSFQHRMHPDIASYSRDIIYKQKALRTANTITERDQQVKWDFAAGTLPARRVWLDVRGDGDGVNQQEIDVIEEGVRQFQNWAASRKAPEGRLWEVACLCFYTKQERAMSEMLQRLSGTDQKSRFVMGNVEVRCGTVDRFQGREADLCFLAMRNTGRVGFLDSPNRLNVAVTRARQQLVIVGHHEYFEKRCHVPELESLAKMSMRIEMPQSARW
jgi:hypothetical protein